MSWTLHGTLKARAEKPSPRKCRCRAGRALEDCRVSQLVRLISIHPSTLNSESRYSIQQKNCGVVTRVDSADDIG